MPTTELKVDGMTCASCVASVTRALERVPGVQDVEVDLGSGIVRVHGEHVAQQVPALIAALGEAGYGAGAAAGAPAVHQHRAGGCGARAGAAGKGRSGCCCG
ncbi:MAG: heavy-metal-associated domain-containing protein [Burkholderiales bacterium]|nr:heavy-metal-associated domain-containing protein [Burkholderiales bacterium]